MCTEGVFTRTDTVTVPVTVTVKFIIVLMMTARLTGRMGVEPILPVRQTVTIGTIVKLDGDGHGDGIGTCKHTLNVNIISKKMTNCNYLTTERNSFVDFWR